MAEFSGSIYVLKNKKCVDKFLIYLFKRRTVDTIHIKM